MFVHGCYWHHCPRCQPGLPRSNAEFWLRKFELNRERDERKRRDLEALGWVVHEIWECDIRERLASVIGTVCRDLSTRGRPRRSGHRAGGSCVAARRLTMGLVRQRVPGRLRAGY